MPSNRSNDKRGKTFAIGTKIKYNGKLYEVVQGKFCDDCSIASVCSNSDKSSNIKGDLLIEERIKVFGECSSTKRRDTKSVVFKEVPANEEASANEEDVYDIEVLYKNDKELLPIRISIPSGYTIDEEHSDLTNGIIRFKRKWLSIEDIYRLVKENNYFTYRSSIISFHDGKLIALANLMDIARYFNDGFQKANEYTDEDGYIIAYDNTTDIPHYIICKYNTKTNANYGVTVFNEKEDAQYVIDNPNFRAILDKIFKV